MQQTLSFSITESFLLYHTKAEDIMYLMFSVVSFFDMVEQLQQRINFRAQ